MTRTAYTLIFIGLALLLIVLVVPFIIYPATKSPSTPATIQNPAIFKSGDNGITWSPSVQSSDILANVPSTIISFVFDPVNPKTIYLGSKGAGLWVTKNSGAAWSRLIDAAETLLPTADIYDLSVSPQDPDIIYVAAFQNNKGRIMRSIDGGISFQQVYAVPIERFGVFGVSADPNQANVVVMVTGQGGFFTSRDGGVTWRIQKWFPDGLVKLMRVPRSSSEFYVITSDGELFHTVDSGESWIQRAGYRGFKGASDIHDILIDPIRPAVLYSASDFGILRSEDRGAVWRPVRLIVPPDALSVSAIAVDPANGARVLAAIKNQIYRSDDFGDHWQVIGVPTSRKIIMMRFDPADSRNVFVVVGK